MANPLFVRVAPAVLARQRQAIETVENLSVFKRLAAIVEEGLADLDEAARPADFRARPVEVRLAFDWADARERQPRATGTVTSRLPATCQRCLEPCELDLAATIDLLLVPRGDAQSVDDALEIWEVDDDRLRPLDIVEELLVMALPLAATHADEKDCGTLRDFIGEENSRDTVRPFADLKNRLGR